MLEESIEVPRNPAPTRATTADPARRGVAIGPCPPGERADALAVLYHRLSGSARSGMIVELLRQEAGGLLDLSGLWVAYRRRRIVGAMLTQALAGRAVALWPPVIARSWRAGALASAMVRDAIASYRSRGALLAQALVERGLPPRAGEDLARGGLPYVTDLAYLGRPTADPLPLPPGLPVLRWECYTPAVGDAFARTLERSYVGSLDMPELEGVRHLDDVLQGHRARGRFDPSCWRVGRLRGEPEPSAILLLYPGEGRTWEVSYLGLAPEARGRGLGRAVLAHALELARPHADRIELAVDVRNLPADRLYHRCGFRGFDRRGVHLAILGRPEGPPLTTPRSRPADRAGGGSSPP